MTKSTGVDNCGARRAAVFPDLPTLRDNPSQPRRATRRRTASTLSRLFGPTPAMRSRARTRLPASAAATLALLLVASACVASAGATRPSLGLESMGTEACAETRAFCEGTVMDAVRADAKLVAFLTDARDSAASSSADADVSLADAHRATAASGALKFPELLALGCCLTAGGGCAADVLARTTHDDLDAARSAADASAAAAEIFVLAASHPDASRLPASRLLAANAFACQPLAPRPDAVENSSSCTAAPAPKDSTSAPFAREKFYSRATPAIAWTPPAAARARKSSPERYAPNAAATTMTTTTTTTRHPPRATPWTPPTRGYCSNLSSRAIWTDARRRG